MTVRRVSYNVAHIAYLVTNTSKRAPSNPEAIPYSTASHLALLWVNDLVWIVYRIHWPFIVSPSKKRDSNYICFMLENSVMV